MDVRSLGSDLEFTAEFDSNIGGKILTDACKYRLHDFLSTEEVKLEVIDHWSVDK
jgi:hypothetical protein